MMLVRTPRIANDFVEIELQMKRPQQLHDRRMYGFSKTTSYGRHSHIKSLSGTNQRVEFLDSRVTVAELGLV